MSMANWNLQWQSKQSLIDWRKLFDRLIFTSINLLWSRAEISRFRYNIVVLWMKWVSIHEKVFFKNLFVHKKISALQWQVNCMWYIIFCHFGLELICGGFSSPGNPNNLISNNWSGTYQYTWSSTIAINLQMRAVDWHYIIIILS